MSKEIVQVKELNFELNFPENEDESPDFEIENNTSAVLVKVDLGKAIELRDLLTRFIEASHAE